MYSCAQPREHTIRAPLQTDQVDVWYLVRGVWKNAWIVIAVVTVAAAISLLRSTLQAKLWSSTSEVQVLDPGSASLFPHQNQVNLAREVALQAIFAQSASVAQGAQIRLGRDVSKIDSVTISGDPTGNGIQFHVISVSRPVAQEAAGVYATAYIDARRKDIGNILAAQGDKLHNDSADIKNQIAGIDKQLADTAPPVIVDSTGTPVVAPESEQQKALRSNRDALATRAEDADRQASLLTVESSVRQNGISVIAPAPWPDVPVQPTPLLDLAVAGGLGMFLGLGLATARARRDDRVSTPDDAEDLIPLGIVVVAVPHDPPYPKKGGPALLRPEDDRSREREAYRDLRAGLLFGHHEHRCERILVTSPNQGDGRTSTAANLAVTVATSGARVALVDCDLRRPGVHAVFDLANDVGLVSVVRGTSSLRDALTTIDLPGSHHLAVLTAGPTSDNPAELLMSEAVGTILDRLAENYDFVICDSSPVGAVADAVPLADASDGILIVARAGRTRKREISAAIARLSQMSADLVAVVINQVKVKAKKDQYAADRDVDAAAPASFPKAGSATARAERDSQAERDLRSRTTPDRSSADG